jgi:hypothetical protein
MAVLHSSAGLDRSDGIQSLRCWLQHARYKVHVLSCIGGSLVLTLLHGLVLYSAEAEIGYRRTRSYQPWTFLLQDRTRLWSSYADGHSFAGIRHTTFVSFFRWPSLRVPIVSPRDLDLADSTTCRLRMAVVHSQRREPRLLLAYMSNILRLQVQEEMSKTRNDTRGATL